MSADRSVSDEPIGKIAKRVFPGERLAAIEEFSSGTGSAVLGEAVVATVVGEIQPDMANRVMNVKAAKLAQESLPKTGDYIVGTVQSAQSSVAQVKIEGLNDTPNNKEFTGMLSFRDDRRRRGATSPVKAGDTLRAKVISTKNSIYHLSMDDPTCGVLYTVCSVCGSEVVALGSDRVKCRECGWVDERMLAEDFIKYSRSQATS